MAIFCTILLCLYVSVLDKTLTLYFAKVLLPFFLHFPHFPASNYTHFCGKSQ
nr:MAG TPA: hypothetical protein [Caudoviricetes sp.]